MVTVKRQSEVFGTILMDIELITAARNELAKGYANKDKAIITKAAYDVQRYVDTGYDDDGVYSAEVDDYNGSDPETLARQYIIHVYHDRYLDDDSDQTYIKTGLKPYMRNWGKAPIQLSINF